MNIKELKIKTDKLDLSDKIILVEDIWDSIASSNSKLPLYEWQKAELDKRYEESRKCDSESFDWKKVHDELRKKQCNREL